MKDVMAFLDESHSHVYRYLPDRKLELPKTPKQWICNIVASVVGEPFGKWVKKQVETRHEKVSVKKSIMISMDPEIAKVFKQSTAVSSKCHHARHLSDPSFYNSHQGRVSQPPLGQLKAPPHQGPDRR